LFSAAALWLQAAHPGNANVCSEAQNGCCFAGISRVFVCTFLLL
jgi:hypothetical protein